ncbi:MAG: peptidase S41, partial [Candidatus Hydrothermota bacterium]
GGAERDTGVVQAITPWALRDTVYWNWVDANRKIVDSLSDGRIGYIHLRGMGNNNLREFYEQLYRERHKDALIIDVRFNGGGRVHDAILNFLSRVPYGFTTERGDTFLRPEPEFKWNKPVVMLINEYSFSDAEIFPMGFKQLGLGKVIGVPTYGGVIGTYNTKLMDGRTVFRVPIEGWYRLDKTPLENKPVEPDIYVENPPEYDNRPGGPQIEKAVEVLLEMLEKPKQE